MMSAISPINKNIVLNIFTQPNFFNPFVFLS